MGFWMDRSNARESPGGSCYTSVMIAAATESVIKRFIEQEGMVDSYQFILCLMSLSIKEPPTTG
jgi:hypothetical protein